MQNMAGWTDIILAVKTSDLKEIEAAYQRALPFVIQGWANLMVGLSRKKQLAVYRRILRTHGERTAEMLRVEIGTMKRKPASH